MGRNNYGFSLSFCRFYNFISFFPAGREFNINSVRPVFKGKEGFQKPCSVFFFSFPLSSFFSGTVGNEYRNPGLRFYFPDYFCSAIQISDPQQIQPDFKVAPVPSFCRTPLT